MHHTYHEYEFGRIGDPPEPWRRSRAGNLYRRTDRGILGVFMHARGRDVARGPGKPSACRAEERGPGAAPRAPDRARRPCRCPCPVLLVREDSLQSYPLKR
jgi:hypothetical protein